MTTFKIVLGFPPNIEKIRETFELSGNEIFAWDGTIYSPNKDLPQWLINHEKVHFKQQDGDPEGWWERYLTDDQFRLDQEIPAHQEEYRTFCRVTKDRNEHTKKKIELARRLSSKMYGNMMTMTEAMRIFK